jgi:hypothetical protein
LEIEIGGIEMRLQSTIIAYLILALVVPNYAAATETPQQNTKDKVTKYSEGKNPIVVVKLKNGEKLKGRVGQVSEDGFTIAYKDGRPLTTVAYADVAEVKKAGLHPLIVVGIVGGVVFGILVAAMFASCGSGGC